MRKLILVISTWFVLLTIAPGQAVMNFTTLDKQSYELYLEKRWQDLISLGKNGLDNGIDYFYLRMRIGIAYYELRNYRRAIPHFRKALIFNSKDQFTNEYLYYSYLFSGRNADAINLSEKFTVLLQQKLGIGKVTGLKSFSVYNTYSLNTNQEKLDDFNIPGDTSTDGWQNVMRSYNLIQLNFEHVVLPGLRLSHGYGYFIKQRFHFFRQDGISGLYPEETYKQIQIYVSGDLLVSHGFTAGLTLHYINLRPLVYYETGGARAWQPGSTYASTNRSDNFAGYFSLNKDLGTFTVGLGLGAANLNDNIQFQKDLFLSVFPLGNLNFYLSSKATHHSDFLNLDNPVNKWIFEQKIGIKVFKPVWIELYGSFGEKSDFIDYSGTVIYNEFNPLTSNMGFNLIFSHEKTGTQLYLNWRNQTIRSSFNFYSDNTINTINDNVFNIQTITGGVKWNF
ncbi:MAG: tetratricopeptide repeat protein [Bacteroidetes bacterium]|nr:tetratricopeptide repeat protein [Bacteroidota bacterium]